MAALLVMPSMGAAQDMIGATRETAGPNPATCIFEHYPAEKRATMQVTAEMTDEQVDQLMEGELFTDQEMAVAFGECRVRPELPGIAEALTGVQYKLVTGRWLALHLNKTEAQIEAAWRKAGPPVLTATNGWEDPRHGDAVRAATKQFLLALGLPRDRVPERNVLHFAFSYMMGRDALERMEPTG